MRTKPTWIYRPVILAIFFLSACTDKKPKPVDFTLDVIVTSNLDGGTSSVLPGDLQTLYSPVVHPSCEQKIFLAAGEIQRVDQKGTAVVTIKDEDDWKVWIQKKTSGQTEKMIREHSADYLSKVPINALNSGIATTPQERLKAITDFQKLNHRYETILVYSDERKKDSFWNNMRMEHNIDKITAAVAEAICNDPKSKVLVIYDPPEIDIRSVYGEEIENIRHTIERYDSCLKGFLACFPLAPTFPDKKRRMKAYSGAAKEYLKDLDRFFAGLDNSSPRAEHDLKDSISEFHNVIEPGLQKDGCYYRALLPPCILTMPPIKTSITKTCDAYKRSIRSLRAQLRRYPRTPENQAIITDAQNQLRGLEKSFRELCNH